MAPRAHGEVRSAIVYTHPHGYDLRAMVGDEWLHAQVLADIRRVVHEDEECRAALEGGAVG